MIYFIDTEFSERGPDYPIQLISIGIVRMDGSELYRISKEFHERGCNQWVKQNVLPHLEGPRHSRSEIRHAIQDFVGVDPSPEFWGYYSAYDWVVFCQIFGAMIDLPRGWPMFCRDIKQLANDRGNPPFPEKMRLTMKTSNEHNALHDARWNRLAWQFLNGL